MISSILFVVDRYLPHLDGVAVHTHGLAAVCARQGWRVTVACTGPRPPSEIPDTVEGVQICRFAQDPLGSRLLRKIYAHPRLYKRWARTMSASALSPLLPAASARILRALLKLDYELLVCMNVHGLAGYYCGLLRALTKRPLLIVPCLHPHKPGGVLRAEQELLRLADGIAASTEYERSLLAGIGIPAHRTRTIGPGVDPIELNPGRGRRLREELGLGEAPVVLYLGRIAASKGIDTLIEAMRQVRQAQPDAHLIVAGSLGDYRPEQHPQWRCSETSGKNLLLCNVSEQRKDELLNACDLLVLASQYESFGIVLAEAWLHEKPVVVSNTPALREVVQHGVGRASSGTKPCFLSGTRNYGFDRGCLSEARARQKGAPKGFGSPHVGCRRCKVCSLVRTMRCRLTKGRGFRQPAESGRR